MLTINTTTCKACGICGIVCPRRIPVTKNRLTTISSERQDLCMDCGHCAAVCPSGSIAIDGLGSEQLQELEELTMRCAVADPLS